MWGITLQRNSGTNLSRQIYLALRERILAGELKPGDALPSTRELSRSLAVSRNTTCEAYEMLSAEGYLSSRQGAATRVATVVDLGTEPESIAVLSKTRLVTDYRVDFRTGQPDLEAFPRHAWLQAMHRASESLSTRDWGYTGPEGLDGLRSQIAAWLLRNRGMKVFPQDIFISSGATQALNLLTEILHRDGSPHIIVEDPCHSGMLQVLQNKGFQIRPIPVDDQGLQTHFLTGLKPGTIYVTPSHQFPLGGVLPAGRRTALIAYARQHKQYIIEDDYDSEFRYSGDPIAPLYTLDPQRVIYVGTFSKILFPSLRIGYVILPRTLQTRWRKARTLNDVQNSSFEQAALTEFLGSRRLDRHIRKMRRLYGERRKILLDCLKEDLGNTWEPWGDATGLHLALEFPGWCFDKQFMERASELGLNFVPVNYHCINKELHKDKIILGYGHLEPSKLREGSALLKELFTKKDQPISRNK